MDVDHNGYVSPNDALRVINYMNLQGEGEGEAADAFFSGLGSGEGEDEDDLLGLLAEDQN
jgi:hypothetical protein